MSTNFSEVLSVLAHELRSPLSVLQGYIRLLQRKRDATDPESAMLTAMLGATTRLAALGRQSSELAVWMRRDEPDTPTDAAALMQAIAAHAPAGVTAVLPTGPIAQTQLRVADVQALAHAIGALAELSMRETRHTDAVVALHEDAMGVRVFVAAGPHAGTLAADGTLPATTDPVPFNRGGLGLSLCLASFVLDSHGALATATPDLARIDVRLPRGNDHP